LVTSDPAVNEVTDRQDRARGTGTIALPFMRTPCAPVVNAPFVSAPRFGASTQPSTGSKSLAG